MPEYYSASDLFGFLGKGRGISITSLEAQACGLPVIALDWTDTAEVVKSGKTGFLTPPIKEEYFVQAMLRITKQDELRKSMGREAGNWIANNFDIAKNCSEIIKLAEKAAKKRQAKFK